MPHTPADNRFLPFALGGGLIRRRNGFKPERLTDVALADEIRARTSTTPQHGNTTTYTNPLKDESSQSEGKMRCPHTLYNPQLPSKDRSCEDMFSDVETLKSHIREVHGFFIKANPSGPSQQENYEAIWRELFAGYRGVIPPASGLSADDMRRMQNLRMFEVIEGYIRNQLRQRQTITREELESILNSFRSTSSFLLITEDTGFSGTTAALTRSAPVDQDQRRHKPKQHREDTIPRRRDPDTISDTNLTMNTLTSIDQRKVADVMEKYRELTQSCSDPEYEDDDIGEEETSVDQLDLHRTGQESIHTLNGPGDVGEGPGKTRNGTDRNGRSWTASAHGSTNKNFKRGHSRSSSGGNDDEGGGRKRRKQGNMGSKSMDRSAAKFACPYAKHAPDEPYKAASCCYPGFPTVSRVKEHIYRTHAALIQCPRCFKSFGDEDGLTAHLRDMARCPQLQEKPDTKTITLEQERKLRSKMKSDAPEEVKWKQVYRIVFNLDEASDTPNPYNDRTSSIFQLFSRYEKHSREALPSLVENEIKQVVLHDPIDMGEGLKSALVEIVLKCQESLFASFRGSESGVPRQAVDPNPLDGQYNYMDFPLLNSDMWEFGLEGPGLGGGSFM